MIPKIELKNISKSYDNNAPVIKDLSLTVEPGSFTVLLGPSGCGKSTILRMIAGLETETSGTISIDGKDMLHVAPSERHIAMVFQNYALYPTMTVRENIAFGLKNMKVPKEERNERIKTVCEIIGLTEYLDRKPSKLSGGQRQRVALARAMVKKPSVFLMDEPLSNLDAKLRNQIRTELIELHKRLNTTFVYVTHDQTEAMSMATHIVLLKEGKIIQESAPLDIYHHPENIFTARFIGQPPMNVIASGTLEVGSLCLPEDTAYIGFRPEACAINAFQSDQQSTLSFIGELTAREVHGNEIIYHIKKDTDSVFVKAYNAEMLDYGTCTVSVSHDDLVYFNANEERIYHKERDAYA